MIASDALMAGKVRMIRLETAVGPFVPGLTEKREKVPHPELQHVDMAIHSRTAEREAREQQTVCTRSYLRYG